MADDMKRPRPKHPDKDASQEEALFPMPENMNPPLAYLPTPNALSGPGVPLAPLTPPLGPSQTDVQGSYTGVPMYDEQPVQDADDL